MLLSASQPIWSLPPEGVAGALQSTLQGLSHPEAQRRLERFGANRLPSLRRRPLWLRFTDQLLHFMALLLWVAGALAFAAHMPQLGWAIWAVVLVNGLFSFVQEYQAERTLAALKRSLPHEVRLWRDGELTTLAAAELVPGDLILLEEGGQVPADARLIRSVELYLDLSVLTGESLPVARHGEPLPSQAVGDSELMPMRERANLVFAGTTVASGHGEAMVYATGGETEFGHVAHLTAATDRSASTLEMQVGQIVRTITAIAVLMGVLTFGLSLLFVGVGPLESLIFCGGDHRGQCAGGAVAHGHPGPGPQRAAYGPPKRPGAAHVCGGNPRLGECDLQRQDRHAHLQSHGGGSHLAARPRGWPPAHPAAGRLPLLKRPLGAQPGSGAGDR